MNQELKAMRYLSRQFPLKYKLYYFAEERTYLLFERFRGDWKVFNQLTTSIVYE